MLSRRVFGALVVGAAVAGSAAAHAQQNPGGASTGQTSTGRAFRIGALSSERSKKALLLALHDAAYDGGDKLTVEFRSIDEPEMLARFAAELVALKVDVIVASGTQAVRAAQQATQSIPIVMTGSSDPVGSGLVASLARPGGNTTGMSLFNPELSGKRLELLKEIVGEIPRVAVLWNPDDPPAGTALKETEIAARALGIAIQPFEIRRADDFDAAFAAALKDQPKAVVVLSAPVMSTNSRRIAAWALQNRLPAIFWPRDFPAAGGLMSYGPDFDSLVRRSVVFVDKILKGAKPADLPIEQPTKFDLVINLTTAKALGLTVPQTLLLRADEVIE
jgi:putative ABC transport system substrate-binding protein